MSIQPVNSKAAPEAIGPYSQAVNCNGVLYVSGQLPLNPETNTIETTDIVSQTKQIMSNIEAILKEADFTFDNVVKTTIYLTNLDYFADVNQVYGSYFKDHLPARVTVGINSLPKNSLIEIDAIAG